MADSRHLKNLKKKMQYLSNVLTDFDETRKGDVSASILHWPIKYIRHLKFILKFYFEIKIS